MHNKLYTCPRCGYKTLQRNDMRRHLYEKKKVCPSQVQELELTNDIKDNILDNRVYMAPKQDKINSNMIVNFNTINALIAGMDPIDKLTKYINYKNMEITDIDDHIDEVFVLKSKRLENNKFKNFSLSIADMLEVVDSVTSMCQVDNLNILYDEKLNKLKLFSCGEWKSQLIDSGIKELIEKIQACYLNSYECYLIRKIVAATPLEKQQAQEHLELFYKFIACFDITPFVADKSNNQILYNADDDRYHQGGGQNAVEEYSMQDYWYAKYKKIKESITTQEHNRVTKSVKDIIKRNSRNNIVDLNKMMMELFHMDESFKKSIINEITLSMGSL